MPFGSGQREDHSKLVAFSDAARLPGILSLALAFRMTVRAAKGSGSELALHVGDYRFADVALPSGSPDLCRLHVAPIGAYHQRDTG